LKAVLPKFVLEKMWGYSLLQWLWDLIRKILDRRKHPNARINLFPQFARYNSAQCAEATKLYQEIARKMVNFNRVVSGIYRTTIFVTSTIIELQQWNN
jgi:hypothetical protein